MASQDRSAEIGIAIARFLFGAAMGVVLILFVWLFARFHHASLFLTLMAGAALVGGLLGLFIGDRFIDGFKQFTGEVIDWLSWW